MMTLGLMFRLCNARQLAYRHVRVASLRFYIAGLDGWVVRIAVMLQRIATVTVPAVPSGAPLRPQLRPHLPWHLEGIPESRPGGLLRSRRYVRCGEAESRPGRASRCQRRNGLVRREHVH